MTLRHLARRKCAEAAQCRECLILDPLSNDPVFELPDMGEPSKTGVVTNSHRMSQSPFLPLRSRCAHPSSTDGHTRLSKASVSAVLSFPKFTHIKPFPSLLYIYLYIALLDLHLAQSLCPSSSAASSPAQHQPCPTPLLRRLSS